MKTALLLLGIMGSIAAQTASDDFERATLGSNWMISFPTSGTQVQILGNSDLGMAAGPQGFFLANWVGTPFAADQFCEAVIPQDVAPNWAHQVYVRRRSSDAARYGFGFENDPNQTLYYNKWYFKYDGVAEPQTRMFGLVDLGPQAPKPGDTLRVEIRGYKLYGYWNGRLMTSATDSASNRIANGVPGLAARVANGNQSITQNAKAWESWRGGALTTTRISPYRFSRAPAFGQTGKPNRAIDIRGRFLFISPGFPLLVKGATLGN